tara:strand:+ start:84 stop:875 length:792 start_codon:yes stop_codon:yes gene_type:complete
MTTAQAFLLGVLQGLTEFLPVSSSGHLVLAETFFDLRIDPLNMQSFNVLLHAGTLLALVICYAKQWGRILLSPFRDDHANRRLLILLVVATVPGALAGLLLEEVVALHLSSLSVVALAFLITAMVLMRSERTEQSKRIEHLSSSRILLVGLAQACALVPGISRSGFTIAAARFFRVERSDALDFSFLLAVPIIAGATGMSLWNIQQGTVALPGAQIIFIGCGSAFLASMLAIRFLRSFVVENSLAWFSWYLVVASISFYVFGI